MRSIVDMSQVSIPHRAMLTENSENLLPFMRQQMCQIDIFLQSSPSIPGRSGSSGGFCIAAYFSASVQAWLDSCSREENSSWSAMATIPKGWVSACPKSIPFCSFRSRSDVLISRTGNGCIRRISATPLAMYNPSAFPFCRAWRKLSPGAAQYTHT
jgi:hypothetical protein